MAFVGLSDSQEPISAALERAGAAGANIASFPVLAVPLRAFMPRKRAALRLPVLPPG